MTSKLMLICMVALALLCACAKAQAEPLPLGHKKSAKRCCPRLAVPARLVPVLARPPQTMSIEQAEQYRRCTRAGDVCAQYEYGRLLLEGTAVKKDPRQATQWLQRAVQEGSGRTADLLEQPAAGTQMLSITGAVDQPRKAPATPGTGSDTDVEIYRRQVEQGLLPDPSFGGQLQPVSGR